MFLRHHFELYMCDEYFLHHSSPVNRREYLVFLPYSFHSFFFDLVRDTYGIKKTVMPRPVHVAIAMKIPCHRLFSLITSVNILGNP